MIIYSGTRVQRAVSSTHRFVPQGTYRCGPRVWCCLSCPGPWPVYRAASSSSSAVRPPRSPSFAVGLRDRFFFFSSSFARFSAAISGGVSRGSSNSAAPVRGPGPAATGDGLLGTGDGAEDAGLAGTDAGLARIAAAAAAAAADGDVIDLPHGTHERTADLFELSAGCGFERVQKN